MKKVYSKGNYIVFEDNGQIIGRQPKSLSIFYQVSDGYRVGTDDGVFIHIQSQWITNEELYHEDGTTLWTEDDFLNFLYDNTSFSRAGSSAITTDVIITSSATASGAEGQNVDYIGAATGEVFWAVTEDDNTNYDIDRINGKMVGVNPMSGTYTVTISALDIKTGASVFKNVVFTIT